MSIYVAHYNLLLLCPKMPGTQRKERLVGEVNSSWTFTGIY